MIKQPDTSTRAGRHAVELASDKFRIQFKTRPAGKDWCWVEVYPEDGAKTWSTQKRDVWTIDERVILECNGMAKAPLSGIPRSVRNEILAALNGAPAADGMVINPDRYWYERSREADAEITELKRQLAAKDGSIKIFLMKSKNCKRTMLISGAE
jgi:hypothetical protein